MNRYQNFTIVLTGYKGSPGNGKSESFYVRVENSPDGSYQEDKEVTNVEIPSGFRDSLRRLESRDLSIEELIELGEILSNLLLPLTSGAKALRSVRDFYHTSRGKLKPEHGLRIQIRAENAELGKIPWEYVYVPDPETPPSRRGREGFLALDRKISIVRLENRSGHIENVAREKDDLRVAVMLSDGDGTDWPILNLDQEEVHILQALEGVDGVEINVLRPGTLTQFEDLVSSSERTEIFHFSGHGKFVEEMGDEPGSVNGYGSLILAGENGKPFELEAQNLARELNGRGVRLAVLGACEAAESDIESPWSGVASALVREKIPAVVGMRYTIRDISAIAFSRRFYQALAAGKSIDSAVSEGRMGIYQRAGSSDRDWGVPVVYVRNDNPVLFPKPMGPIRKNLGLFAVTSLFMVAWFLIHAFQFVSYQLAAFAGYVGVAITAIPFLSVAFRWVVSKVSTTWNWREKDTWFESLMRHRLTSRVLWSALGLSVFMLLTTVSISLELDTDEIADFEITGVEITVIEDDKLCCENAKSWRKLPVLETNSLINKNLDGGIFFRLPFTSGFVFQVARPYGFKLTTNEVELEKLKPGLLRSIKLKASKVLEPDDSRAFRLVTMLPLHDYFHLPDSDSTSCSENGEVSECTWYELRVNMDADNSTNDLDATNSKKYVLHKGIVYFGVHEWVLTNQLGSESKVDRREELRACLPDDLPPNENRGHVLDLWIRAWKPDSKAHYQYIPDLIMKEGQSVKLGGI